MFVHFRASNVGERGGVGVGGVQTKNMVQEGSMTAATALRRKSNIVAVQSHVSIALVVCFLFAFLILVFGVPKTCGRLALLGTSKDVSDTTFSGHPELHEWYFTRLSILYVTLSGALQDLVFYTSH